VCVGTSSVSSLVEKAGSQVFRSAESVSLGWFLTPLETRSELTCRAAAAWFGEDLVVLWVTTRCVISTGVLLVSR